MKAVELLSECRRLNPSQRFAVSKTECAVGLWQESLGRFVPVYMKWYDGRWCHMPYELMVNGQPPYKPEDWLEAIAA